MNPRKAFCCVLLVVTAMSTPAHADTYDALLSEFVSLLYERDMLEYLASEANGEAVNLAGQRTEILAAIAGLSNQLVDVADLTMLASILAVISIYESILDVVESDITQNHDTIADIQNDLEATNKRIEALENELSATS